MAPCLKIDGGSDEYNLDDIPTLLSKLEVVQNYVLNISKINIEL